jgi:site-specific DNA-methyltransferase (cytosine-N4-specific)
MYYKNKGIKLYLGNAAHILNELEPNSIDVALTSPPYFAKRDYGLEPMVFGGDFSCEHDWKGLTYGRYSPRPSHSKKVPKAGPNLAQADLPRTTHFCSKCNAWLGTLGNEPTVELYVEHMVEVFRGLKRVLGESGMLWLNLGDTYNSGSAFRNGQGASTLTGRDNKIYADFTVGLIEGYKKKDLMGVPFKVAFGLQEDGWWLRNIIPWMRRNALPESVKDRFTATHEWLFALTPARSNYFDIDAIKVGIRPDTAARERRARSNNHKMVNGAPGQNSQTLHQPVVRDHTRPVEETRQFRDSDLYFMSLDAEIEAQQDYLNHLRAIRNGAEGMLTARNGDEIAAVVNIKGSKSAHFAAFPERLPEVLLKPSCPPGGTVLDLFCGTGTTGVVANRLGLNFVGIDAQPKYLDHTIERIAQDPAASLAMVRGQDFGLATQLIMEIA